MLAPHAFLLVNLKFFANSSINLYMDSNNCIASLTRGDAIDDFIAAMVALFWKLTHRYSIDIWIGRARSKLNIADLPTKKFKRPLQAVKSQAFPSFLPLFLLRMKLK